MEYAVYGKSGQSLIEVVVSAGIAVILVVALISTSLIVQKSARVAKNNTQATKLAQEAIEQLRVIRDRQGFGAVGVSPCEGLDTLASNPASWKFVPDCGQYITPPSSNTKFTRKISVVGNGNNKTITVTISWDESGGQKFVSSQTILSDWAN